MSEFQDLTQCHGCNRILGPDDTTMFRDNLDGPHGIDVLQCGGCGSIDVDRFGPEDLCKELGRIRNLNWVLRNSRLKMTNAVEGYNLDQIQIVLEKVFEL